MHGAAFARVIDSLKDLTSQVTLAGYEKTMDRSAMRTYKPF